MLQPTPALDRDAQLAGALARLRDLLAEGDIEGARTHVRMLAAQWPGSERVRHFARVLAPPRTLGTRPGTGRSLKREHEWLRVHGHRYPGCWLALAGDRLIAADPDLQAVLDAVEDAEGVSDPLLHRQPDGSR
jgi:hypothetical protein